MIMIFYVNSIYVILEYNQVFNLLDGILETELWQNENSEEVHQEHTEECSESIAVQEVDESENEIQDVDDSEDEIQDADDSEDELMCSESMAVQEVDDSENEIQDVVDSEDELQNHDDFENSQAEIQDINGTEEDMIQNIENSEDKIQKKMEVMEVEDISD